MAAQMEVAQQQQQQSGAEDAAEQTYTLDRLQVQVAAPAALKLPRSVSCCLS